MIDNIIKEQIKNLLPDSKKGRRQKMIDLYNKNKDSIKGSELECPVCHSKFVKNQYSQSFCSKECKNYFWNHEPERKKKAIERLDNHNNQQAFLATYKMYFELACPELEFKTDSSNPMLGTSSFKKRVDAVPDASTFDYYDKLNLRHIKRARELYDHAENENDREIIKKLIKNLQTIYRNRLKEKGDYDYDV